MLNGAFVVKIWGLIPVLELAMPAILLKPIPTAQDSSQIVQIIQHARLKDPNIINGIIVYERRTI